MDTGNVVEGYDVHHSLKSGWQLSTVSDSHTRSSSGIHDTARWQFCSTTHEPSSRAFLIIADAIGPWPWPSEIESTFFFTVSAKYSSAAIGSEPGDSTNTRGCVTDESACEPARSNGGGDRYCSPIDSFTNSWMASDTLSARMHRTINSFWNGEMPHQCRGSRALQSTRSHSYSPAGHGHAYAHRCATRATASKQSSAVT
jgi:hypothetical protein